MKEYCVDLEIAKELKKHGFPQETEFYFSRSDGQVNLKDKSIYDFSNICGGQGRFDKIYDPRLRYEYYSAPTSDEILKELHNKIKGAILEIVRYENGTIEVDYKKYPFNDIEPDYLIQSEKIFYKLSDALATLWLDLKKGRHI